MDSHRMTARIGSSNSVTTSWMSEGLVGWLFKKIHKWMRIYQFSETTWICVESVGIICSASGSNWGTIGAHCAKRVNITKAVHQQLHAIVSHGWAGPVGLMCRWHSVLFIQIHFVLISGTDGWWNESKIRLIGCAVGRVLGIIYFFIYFNVIIPHTSLATQHGPYTLQWSSCFIRLFNPEMAPFCSMSERTLC